jgi:hypothetical protein
MNQKLFLVLVTFGWAVAACNGANPESSTPETAGDASGMLGDASDATNRGASAGSNGGGDPGAHAGPGAYRGGSFLPSSTRATDAGVCVTIDPSAYDTSCKTKSDCMAASTGVVCSLGCMGACPNTAINVRGKAHYEQALRPVSSTMAASCGCGSQDASVDCIASVCTYCPHGCGNEARWQTF